METLQENVIGVVFHPEVNRRGTCFARNCFNFVNKSNSITPNAMKKIKESIFRGNYRKEDDPLCVLDAAAEMHREVSSLACLFPVDYKNESTHLDYLNNYARPNLRAILGLLNIPTSMFPLMFQFLAQNDLLIPELRLNIVLHLVLLFIDYIDRTLYTTITAAQRDEQRNKASQVRLYASQPQIIRTEWLRKWFPYVNPMHCSEVRTPEEDYKYLKSLYEYLHNDQHKSKANIVPYLKKTYAMWYFVLFRRLDG
jgi:hypothetical protein